MKECAGMEVTVMFVSCKNSYCYIFIEKKKKKKHAFSLVSSFYKYYYYYSYTPP